MATNTFETSHIGVDFFDIYNDATVVARTAIPQLPNGSCNYVDLALGAGGSRCGCRRFWARQTPGSPGSDQSGWCMCNHHACYHDEGPRETQLPDTPHVGQENERPRTGREPLSPMLELTTANATSTVFGVEFPSFGGVSQLSFLQKSFEGRMETAAVTTGSQPQQGASMPDTLAWTDLIQSQPDLNIVAAALPPIPSQCLMPSQAASTVSSIPNSGYLKPFAGKGLHTLSSAPKTNQTSPNTDEPKTQDRNNPLPPTSHPDAPSIDGSTVFMTNDEGTPGRPGTAATQVEPRAASTEPLPRQALKNLTDTVSAHSQRLDRLETVSFSGANHEECHERHDQIDIRMADLESRVDDIEKNAGNDDSGSRRHNQLDGGATPSIISMASSSTSRPTFSQEIYSQLQSLQEQVHQLQSAIPSHNHLWEVEVVFLPFPLKRVWQHGHQFKDPVTDSGDDWTQLPMTHSTTTIRSQSPFHGDWAMADSQVEWLLPRACGDKSLTDKRLRSRGLIQKISIAGPDARSVQSAINTAFSSILRDMQMPSRQNSSDPRISKFMGLQSSWVPLRKIHKDSRLRFLSPDEMVTTALWDVQFLNSVMMRSSQPRLFVTHPEAYLQDCQSYETGWTWQKLREANRFYHDITESQEVPEADAMEECWAWNEQLDETPGRLSSSGQRQDSHRVSISPSVAYFPAQSWKSSPTAGPSQTPMMQGRKGSRPPHIRTVSFPVQAGAHASPLSANTKRRVVSGGQSRRSSPALQVASQGGIMKRRRTRSPSHARFTPRWTASPSPMPGGYHDRATARGTTPFAYATPYSNAPLQEIRTVRGSSIFRTGPEYPSDGEGRDDDYDMQIYESGSDESFDSGDNDETVEVDIDADVDVDSVSIASAQVVNHRGPLPPLNESVSWHLPEDQPWPGIEDRNNRSDGENIDPHEEVDHASDSSSQPSEYPSTQRAWPAPGDAPAAGFHIHEDDE